MSFENDKRLMQAAKELEWAVRWYFHMWASRYDGEAGRWESYSEWRRYLKTWTMRKAYGDGVFSGHFINNTITGSDWLLERWCGVKLTWFEKFLLRRMFRCYRPQTKEPKPKQEEPTRPWRFWHWEPYRNQSKVRRMWRAVFRALGG